MKNRSIRYWILVADLLLIPATLVMAMGLRFGGSFDAIPADQRIQNYYLMVIAALVTWAALYFEMSLDGFKGGWHLPAILSKTIVSVCILMTAVSAVAFLTRHNYSRLVLLYFAFVFFAGVVSARCLSRFIVVKYLRATEDGRCLIFGNGPVARELANKIASHPELPFHVVGFLFPGESEAQNGSANSLGKSVTSIRSLQVLDLMAQHRVRKVIIAMGQATSVEIRKLIDECRKASIQVYLVPPLYDLYSSRAELVEIDSVPLLSLQERNPAVANLGLKRILDVGLSVGILLLTSPLLALSALVVYSQKGKAFRSDLRCGKDGVPFRMYRLNVERPNPRPAVYERLFLRWSLTELPQLVNVLRGEMSLVGPRPEAPERVKYYSDWQRQRLKVRAGVTGLAQVHGLREQHSSEDKARFDLQYIFNSSPLLDLGLVLQTVWTLLCRGLNHEPAPSGVSSARPSAHKLRAQEAADVNRS